MTNPYPFQLEDLNRIDEVYNGRALVAWEMGLGKTFLALSFAKRRKLKPIIVVCPASIKYNWEREAALHVNLRAEVLEGTKVPQAKWSLNKPELIILNYDILHKWLPVIKKLKPQLVILDEVHYTKSRSTRRTKACRMLCKGVEHVLALSGTPLINRPIELWPILNMLWPKEFTSYKAFGFRYCKPEFTPWGWKFNGATKVKELNRILKRSCMVRRLKKEVLQDLPNKIRAVVPMKLSKPHEYKKALVDFVDWLRTAHPSKARAALKAEELAKAGYLKRLVAELKLPSVIEWVENFLAESTGKLILFGIHKKIIGELYGHFKPLSVVVDGSVNNKRRQNAIDKFQHDPNCRLFIGNIQAAGVGWNGTAATAVAFCELGWTPGEHIQAEDRAHRIGQKDHVTCYYLVGRDTIEDKTCKLLHKKQKVLTGVLDGKQPKHSGNVFDELIQSIRNT